MIKNILITGIPKSGKSTLLDTVIADIPNKRGFVTKEIRREGERTGFKVITNDGAEAMIASVDFKTQFQVSKYFVDPCQLETVLTGVSSYSSNDILYLDEIGQMQLLSDMFRDFALSYLDAPNICVATISYVYEDDFTKAVKNRNDVFLVQLTPENRADQEVFVRQFVRKLEKASKYLSEPERFLINGDMVTLRSEHDIRTLNFVDGAWNCTCDFNAKYGICSHAVATTEFLKTK